MKRVVFLFLMMIFLTNCVKKRNDCHSNFYVENRTGQDIVFDFTIFEKIIGIPEEYLVVKAGEQNVDCYRGSCFEEYFEMPGKNKPCYLFLWYKDELDLVPTDTIIKYNMYSCRMELTRQQLDSLDWTITIEEGMLKSMFPSNPSEMLE